MGNSLNQEAAPAKSEKSDKSKKSTKNPVAEEPSSTAEPRRRSSSATSMVDGNDQPRRRSSSAAAPASFYVTPEEREHIKMLYALLWPREKDYLDEEFLITLLTSYNMAPTLAKTMKSIFATAKFKNTYEGFEDFLIECTRTSSTASLHIIWKFTRFLAISEDKFDWTSRCKRFCALLLLFSTGKEPASEEELYHSATELAAFYTQIVHRNDASVDCDVDFNTLQNAVHVYSPQAARPLQALFATIFFHADESPSFHPYVPPQTSTQSTLLNDFAAGFLAMAGEPLQGSWKCLYTMATDGISFNRIVHHVLGYDGPTVILIRTTHRLAGGAQGKPIIFGVFCQERWREYNKFYGSAKNFLFTLSPHFRIYHSARTTDNHFQFLATSGFNLPHGLGFGGSVEGFRLFIPDTLEQCTARAICTTYEPGKLVFSDDFDVNNVQFEIEHLEVWGSGGASLIANALKAQANHRHVLAHTIEKARKIDKAQFFNNGFDREFLLGNTFAHHKDMQDRVEEEYLPKTVTAPVSTSAPAPAAATTVAPAAATATVESTVSEPVVAAIAAAPVVAPVSASEAAASAPSAASASDAPAAAADAPANAAPEATSSPVADA